MNWRGIWLDLLNWWNDLAVLVEIVMGLLLLQLLLIVVRAWMQFLGY